MSRFQASVFFTTRNGFRARPSQRPA